jgi:hypothetical protein
MSSKAHRPEEINALRIALPLFESIYGPCTPIPEVVDRPDAAYKTQTGKTIGVEIMGMDSSEYLQYTNTGLSQIKRRIPESAKSHYHEGLPGATRIQFFPAATAHNIVEKKNSKYAAYANGAIQYDQMVLLIHTRNVSITNHPNFPAQDYLFTLEAGLRANNLLFDRVLLVNFKSEDAAEVYRKNHQLLSPTKEYRPIDWLSGVYYMDQQIGVVQIGSEGGLISIDGRIQEVIKTVLA